MLSGALPVSESHCIQGRCGKHGYVLFFVPMSFKGMKTVLLCLLVSQSSEKTLLYVLD